MPKFSVVIPLYNKASTIQAALHSVLNQTYPDFEIIVVDDHSTDGTRAAVKAIAAEDSRVQYHLLPHAAPKRTNWRGYDINAGFAARNYGFSLAKGEWITTQDADDASLLNRIEVQYRMAQRYDATLVTIQWMRLSEATLGKTLDVERIIREHGEESVIIRPEVLAERARSQRGMLMIEPLHRFIPFPIKWFPYTRTLFYRHQDPYLGADNCMLFHRRVLEDGVWFRPRNERTWGTPAGRGTGRDFVYRVAARYQNSYSFRFPMYLWDVRADNQEYLGYERYLL
jgi:glycosyltransferase involved in cell wall biosynthesis